MILVQDITSERSMFQSVPTGVNVISIPRSLDIGTVPEIFYDSDVMAAHDISVWNDYQLSVELGQEIEYISLTPDIATVTTSGLVEHVADVEGIARIEGILTKTSSSFINVDVSAVSGSIIRTFLNYVENSASDIISSSLRGRMIHGKDIEVYSEYDPYNDICTLNPDCWLYGVDISGIPVANSFGGVQTANRGALITPQHHFCCWHYGGKQGGLKGHTFIYKGTSGELYLRTAIESIQVDILGATWPQNLRTDIQLLLLNSPLPSDVTPLAILGDWSVQGYNSIAPIVGIYRARETYISGGVGFWINQYNYACATKLGTAHQKYQLFCEPFAINGTTYDDYVLNATAHTYLASEAMNGGNTEFFRDAIGGDSGCAVCAVVNGKTNLYCTWATEFDGASPIDNHNGDLMNALLRHLDTKAGITTPYTVTITPDPTI